MLKNKKVASVLQIGLSLALLAWLLDMVGLDTLVETFTGLDLAWYLPACLLFQFDMIIRGYRWYLLLNELDDRTSFWQLVYYYYLGFFFNNFIPTGFGGDVVKVIGLRQEYGRGTDAVSSVVMDRLIGLLGSSLIALIALLWSSSQGTLAQIALPGWLTALIAVLCLGVPLGWLVLRLADPMELLVRLLPIDRPPAKLAKLGDLAATVKRYPISALLKSLLTSLPFTIILMLTQYAIARALAVEIPLYLFALFVPIISIVNLLPISFNGLGAREGIYLVLFVPAGVPDSQAVAMSLAFYIIRVGTGLLGGLLFLIKGATGAPRPHRT